MVVLELTIIAVERVALNLRDNLKVAGVRYSRIHDSVMVSNMHLVEPRLRLSFFLFLPCSWTFVGAQEHVSKVQIRL